MGIQVHKIGQSDKKPKLNSLKYFKIHVLTRQYRNKNGNQLDEHAHHG